MTQEKQQESICLIDGSGYIFRAFYALPVMIRPDGIPVNAVYGFMKMLMNLVSEDRCSHIVVIFDAKRKNFRNDIYPAYKENRRETPEALIPQFPLIRKATEVLNISWLEMEGYEADDLIATYARIATQKGWHVNVISADKDLMQLMNDSVSVYDPMKKKELTTEDVLKKFGVTPNKVTDVQSLMGDSTDNVPGASGIGPKTAAELINQFGSLENLLTHLDDIKNEKRRESLKKDKEKIIISQKLVQLDAYAPVSEDLSVFEAKNPNLDEIDAFLTENNFRSLLGKTTLWTRKRISDVSHRQMENKTYELVQTEEVLKKWIERLKKTKYFAIDTETNSLDPMNAKLVGFSLCDTIGHACYVPLRHGGEEKETSQDLFSFQENNKSKRPTQISVSKALQLLSPLLKDKNILKIGHNIKFDMHIFARELGKGFKIEPVADTMILSYILNGTTHGHGMDELSFIYLNHHTIKYTDICGTGKNQITFDQVELDKAVDYAAEDADVTYRLYETLLPKLTEEKQKYIYTDVDMPLVSILYEMEESGIMIDKDHLKNLNQVFSQELGNLTTQIYDQAGEEFNINSPAQLGQIFFEKMGLPGGKKGSNGAYSTDVKVLETLSYEGNELAKSILEYRTFAKLKSTYIDSLLSLADTHCRVHTSFMQTVTNTGRLSSTDPNLQNIPIRTEAGKEIRRSFIAKKGYKLVCADYSQIELRLMADVANVQSLKNSFLKNEDIHARTASQIFNIPLEEITQDIRRKAKAINFGIIYGISAFGLSNQLSISRTEAKQYIDAYFKEYPEIKKYMDQTIAFAEEHGYVCTPFGRRCYIQGMNDSRTKGFASRAAINAPIQGGAADIIKMAMIKVQKELKDSQLDVSLLLQVHDELVFEVQDSDVLLAKEIIKSAMENVTKLSVPLIADVGVGYNWKEAH